MARFDDCLAFTLGPSIEGGVSNNPADAGGLTNAGVTQATYNTWRAQQGLTLQPVTLISQSEISAIYYAYYWVPCKAPQLPVPVDLCMFDMSVNSGQGNAARTLQQVVNVPVDGVIGPATVAAANAGSAVSVATNFVAARDAYYNAIVARNPSQARFLQGWLNRDQLLRDACGIPRT